MGPAELLQTIEELGFSPSLLDDDIPVTGSGRDGSSCEPWPEPIAGALQTAQGTGEPLFLDFFAEWCAPCHTLEEEILPHPAVKEALEGFQFLRIDTDQDPQGSQCLEVFGLPTIVVLDPMGRELFRHQGLLPAEELADELLRLKR